MPRLTAVAEATVGAVYEAIHLMVEIEVDEPAEERQSPSWRELVLTTCRERGMEGLLVPESEDLDEWEALVACLADAVLWDADWQDAEGHLDIDPRVSEGVKKLMGIDQDYYVAVAPDPTEEEMEGVWATLRELTTGGS